MPSPSPVARRHNLADGGTLAVYVWPTAGRPRASAVICHGYLEHAGRYAQLARALQAADVEVWAFDLRGHGRSTGRRGHVHRFADYESDLEEVAQAARSGEAAGRPQAWLAHSLGGLVALSAARRGADGAPSALVLTNPFLRLAPSRRNLQSWLGPTVGRLLPTLRVPANIASEALTSDAEEVALHRADQMILTHATAGWARAVDGAQASLRQTRLATACPVLWVVGEADTVACPAASAAAFARLETSDKTLWRRPAERHEVLHEGQRAALIGDIVAWVAARNR